MNRAQNLKRLKSRKKPWDIIIIGGGASGIGSAIDAASRGYKTLLLEKYDFAKGTSSRSTKLVQVPFVRLTRRIFLVHAIVNSPYKLASFAFAAHLRILSKPVQPESTKVIASVGHALAHAGSPPHKSHLATLPVSTT